MIGGFSPKEILLMRLRVISRRSTSIHMATLLAPIVFVQHLMMWPRCGSRVGLRPAVHALTRAVAVVRRGAVRKLSPVTLLTTSGIRRTSVVRVAVATPSLIAAKSYPSFAPKQDLAELKKVVLSSCTRRARPALNAQPKQVSKEQELRQRRLLRMRKTENRNLVLMYQI